MLMHRWQWFASKEFYDSLQVIPESGWKEHDMTMSIYRKSGEILNITPTSNIDAGSLFVMGALVGITPSAIASGKTGTMYTHGVFENVPKHGTSNTLTAGQVVYVNPSNGKIYGASATGYIPCGYALEAATATSTTCKIYLVPGVQTASAASSG